MNLYEAFARSVEVAHNNFVNDRDMIFDIEDSQNWSFVMTMMLAILYHVGFITKKRLEFFYDGFTITSEVISVNFTVKLRWLSIDNRIMERAVNITFHFETNNFGSVMIHFREIVSQWVADRDREGGINGQWVVSSIENYNMDLYEIDSIEDLPCVEFLLGQSDDSDGDITEEEYMENFDEAMAVFYGYLIV